MRGYGVGRSSKGRRTKVFIRKPEIVRSLGFVGLVTPTDKSKTHLK